MRNDGRLRGAAWLLSAVFALGAAGAEENRLSPWKHPIRRLVLDGGIVLLHQKDATSAVTSLSILIKGGRRAEPEGLAGLSYLAARLMLEMPDGRSARRLMLQASPLSLAGQGDFCLIEVESLSEHFEGTLGILARPMQSPLFTDIRIDALKRFMAHLRRRETEEAASLGRALAMRTFFGNEGYGASPYGTDDSLKAVRNRDVARLYESLFRAENIVLAVVSDRDAEEISALIKKHFRSARPGRPFEPRPLALYEPSGKTLTAEKDTLQSLVGAFYLLPGASPRVHALASLTESLLGKGAASRLWRLRQEGLLAYNIFCDYMPLKDAGILEACLETENHKCAAAVEAIHGVLGDVSAGGVDARELDAARLIALTDFLRENEPKNVRARNMAAYEALGLGHDFIEKIPALYDSVTLEEMNAFLAEWLRPDKALRVVIKGTRKKAASTPRKN